MTIFVEATDDGCARTIAVTTTALHADVVKCMVYLDLNISLPNETAIQSDAPAVPMVAPLFKIEK